MTITDVLPANVHFNAVTTTQGTCSHTTSQPPKTKNGIISCDVGTLAAGTSMTVTVQVTATTPGAAGDSATVTATNVSPDGDDSASASTTVIGK